MDKLLARTAYTRLHVSRKAARITNAKNRLALQDTIAEHTRYQKLISSDRRTTRANERLDKRLGPLAPRRAVGKYELETVGSFDQTRVVPPALPKDLQRRFWNIVENDRVLVLRGVDRHRIGVVKQVDKENDTCIVDGMNKMPMFVPEMFRRGDLDGTAVVWREEPVKYKDLRLVHPVIDQNTNKWKDAVVAEIEMSSVRYDKLDEGKPKWTRYVKGTNIEIPWPEVKEEEFKDRDGDTRIMDVETKTYVPTLLMPPFPESVVDELRGKFSKFRKRHEPEYVALVEQREALKNGNGLVMRKTPVQELNKLAREKRKALGRPEMSEETLELIGRVMAQKKPELLEEYARA